MMKVIGLVIVTALAFLTGCVSTFEEGVLVSSVKKDSPAEHIEAADKLYTDGMSYKNYPDLFTKKNRLIIAIEKFKKIIEKYPTSDKADDAAFRLGQICEGFYFKDYPAAAKYYEACFRWNPNTEYPARYRAAECHSKHTKNYKKAAELYDEAKENSPSLKNRLKAQKKLDQMEAERRALLRTEVKVPLLGDIPIIGWLFKGSREPATEVKPLESERATAERGPPRPIAQSIVWQPTGRREAWAVVVGVGQHKQSPVPGLPFARSDAERVRNWFLNREGPKLSPDNIRILFDEQATRENILIQIDWMRRQAMPEDAVFFYFAGHGAPELAADGSSVEAKYLVLYDTNPDNLFATGFPIDELTRRLDAVKAKVQVVVLEACYSGPVGEEILKKTPTADLEIRPRLIQEMGGKTGRVILTASSGRQIAIASEELKGGLFTHYLLEAWGDGHKRLLTECFEQARDGVRRAANRLGSAQNPEKFGDQNVDVSLKSH